MTNEDVHGARDGTPALPFSRPILTRKVNIVPLADPWGACHHLVKALDQCGKNLACKYGSELWGRTSHCNNPSVCGCV